MFRTHWESHEKSHFRHEEELLLPAYAEHGDPSHPAVTRMLEDHMLIRRDAERLARAPSLELLHQLGVRLNDPVRLEEREVFPLIEMTLPEAELVALGDRLSHALP